MAESGTSSGVAGASTNSGNSKTSSAPVRQLVVKSKAQQQQAYRQHLTAARNQSRTRRGRLQAKKAAVKAAARALNPMEMLALVGQIKWYDLFIIFALACAIIKDVVDFIGVGSIPAIGTVITIICSFVIFFMFLLVGGFTPRLRRRAGFVNKQFKKFAVLLAATIMEFLFGLNFVPFETIAVIIMYYLVLNQRLDNKKEEDRQYLEDKEMQSSGVAV